jgi:hypothetical protein
MATRRSDHTATLMADGRVLVAGGYNATDGCLASAEIFDPETGSWTSTGSMTTARANHQATMIPSSLNLVVVMAGEDCAGGQLRSVETYNPRTQKWFPSHPLVRARAGHSVTLLPSGNLLVAGGYNDEDGILDSLEEYDPLLDEAHEVGNLGTERHGHGASLLNGLVLFVGGESNSGATTKVEWFDPPSGRTGGLVDTLMGHLEASLRRLFDGRHLVIGRSGFDSSPEIFDPFGSGGAMDAREAAAGSRIASEGKPVLEAVTDPLILGSSLQITGTGFLGLSEGSGGRAMDSGTNYPLIQLRRLENEQVLMLPVDTAIGFSDTSFASVPVTDFPVGFAFVTAFVNGVASESRIIQVIEPPVTRIYLPLVTRH